MKAIKNMMVQTKMSPMMKRIAKKYDKKKADRWYRERSVFVSLRVAQLMERHLKQFGPDVEQRSLGSIVKSFRFFHQGLLKDAVTDRAKRLVAFMMR